MKVTERLYLAADHKTVVKGNDKRAAFLLAAKGQELPDIIARQYGLLRKKPAKKQEEQPEDKQAEEPENKQISSSPNKRGRPRKES